MFLFDVAIPPMHACLQRPQSGLSRRFGRRLGAVLAGPRSCSRSALERGGKVKAKIVASATGGGGGTDTERRNVKQRRQKSGKG